MTYLKLTPEVGHETILQHAHIIKAVEAGDEAAAAAAMHEHLTFVRHWSRDYPESDD